MIRSLRMRLFLGVTLVSGVVLGILAVGIGQAVRTTLTNEFDRVLLEKCRSLASMVELTGETTHFDYQPAQFPEFGADSTSAYFEVYTDGVSFRRSASLGSGHLSATGIREHEAMAILLPDGRRARLLAMTFTPFLDDDGAAAPPNRRVPSGLMIVAQASDGLDHVVTHLFLWIAGLCCGAILLCDLALMIVTSFAIRPVGRLAQQIGQLHETALTARLSNNGVPSELAPVVDRLNDLIGRLASSFSRERAFTADVAHELRTPVAGLMATLQVARSRPRDRTGYESAIDTCIAILHQMKALIENLLLLARADSGQLSARIAPVDLEGILEECKIAFESPAAARQIAFNLTGDAPRVDGDSEFLRVIFNNLMENAVSYAASDSAIDTVLFTRERRSFVEITNRGHALKEEDMAVLFERFTRKDSARSATGIHAGLGLSICRRLTELQGGSIALRLDGELFVAQVAFPFSS